MRGISSGVTGARCIPPGRPARAAPASLQERTGGLAARPPSDGAQSQTEPRATEAKEWRMAKHAVVIAGGGPTGMMLAAELALAQVDVVIVGRGATADADRARAGGLHARTIEVLDQRGVADRFLREGKVMQIQGFGRIRLDISDFPARRNYGVALPQGE